MGHSNKYSSIEPNTAESNCNIHNWIMKYEEHRGLYQNSSKFYVIL